MALRKPTETEKLIEALKLLQSPPTILIVEDDPADMETACSALHSIDCRVVEATNGEDAIKMVDTFKFDLAFLDLKMPGCSGIDVLRKIRMVNAALPVVIMTHATYSVLIEEAAQLGYIGLIEKPLRREDVAEIMGKHNIKPFTT